MRVVEERRKFVSAKVYTCVSYVTATQRTGEDPKIRRHHCGDFGGRGKLVPFEFRVVISGHARNVRKNEVRIKHPVFPLLSRGFSRT